MRLYFIEQKQMFWMVEGGRIVTKTNTSAHSHKATPSDVRKSAKE